MVTETSENTEGRPGYGTVGTALGIGIGALALNVLQNGGLGGLLGGPRPPMDPPATQRDLKYERELTTKDAQIGKLESQLYTDQQIAELRKELQAGQAAQAVINAQQTGVIGLLQSQVATLNSMTSLFIKQPVMAASEAALAAFGAKASGTATQPATNG